VRTTPAWPCPTQQTENDRETKKPAKPLPDHLHLDTLAVRAAVDKSQYGENSEALYLTSSFVQPDAETAARRFAGEEEGYIYSRFTNPTVTSMEQRLAQLEGTEACMGTSSGMSAILLLCMGLLKAGDHVICSQSVFGSTIRLIAGEFGKFGVQSTFVSQTDVAQWRAAVQPNTRLLFAETPTNPLTDVCDIEALSKVAHAAGALLAVDNCFCTPALQQPAKLGADLIIHSGTKYLDGQGRVIAGALCTTQKMIDEKFMPVMRSGRHDAVCLQRLGGAQGHGNPVHPHESTERKCIGAGHVAAGTAAGGAGVLPRFGISSAARACHAPAVRSGRCSGVV
jgi:O-succinylhomoserine sulfhydrylase